MLELRKGRKSKKARVVERESISTKLDAGSAGKRRKRPHSKRKGAG